jgi:hypothetical protein
MNAAFDIHMFSAVARATASTVGRTPGQHHPLLIFVRQRAQSDHDLAAAAATAQAQGWDEVDITRAGTLPADAETQMQEPVLSAYRAAKREGSAMVAFEAVVKPAPRKA